MSTAPFAPAFRPILDDDRKRRGIVNAVLILLVVVMPLGALANTAAAAARDAQSETGAYYAIVIGISDYPGRGNDLTRCHEDARRIAQALKPIVPAANVRLLVNGQATVERVREALADVAERVGRHDHVIFFYSGHGGRGPANRRNADEADLMRDNLSLYDGVLWDDELSDALDAIDAAVTLVALDSCHSGGFAPELIDQPGRLGLFSSDEELPSYEADDAGGWLSKFLIEALLSMNEVDAGSDREEPDGMITAGELLAFIERRWEPLDSWNLQRPEFRQKMAADAVVLVVAA